MGDLTRNFSAWEFRCRHTGRDGIQMPLVEALQALRDSLNAPIVVTSGYRHPTHPIEAAKPRGPGLHSRGIAADIVAPGVPLLTLYEAALSILPFQGGGIGVYPANMFLHVDVRGYMARWANVNGREVEIAAGLALLK